MDWIQNAATAACTFPLTTLMTGSDWGNAAVCWYSSIPSAAILASHFARIVDFFSIGTNDLTQYTLAVDRTNQRVAHISSPFHPAVLRLIQMTIEAAHENGRWVGLCGEMAGDPLAIPLLLGMGLDEFSMTPALIPAAKRILRNTNKQECQQIVAEALNLPETALVKKYLSARYVESHPGES